MTSQLHSFNFNYCLSSHFHQRLLCGFCTWTKFFARKDLQIGKALHPSPNKDISPTIPNKKSWRALSLWTKPTKQFETGCQRNSFYISAIFRVQSPPKSVWHSSTNYECVVWKSVERVLRKGGSHLADDFARALETYPKETWIATRLARGRVWGIQLCFSQFHSDLV